MLDGPEAVLRAVRELDEALWHQGARHLFHGSVALVLQGWPIRCPDIDVNLPACACDIHAALRAAEGCGFRWAIGTFDECLHRRCVGTRAGPFKLDLACQAGTEDRLVRWWAPRDYGACLRHAVRAAGVLALDWRQIVAARWRRGYPRDVEGCGLLLSTRGNRL